MLYELTLPTATSVPIHQTATTNCISPVQQKDYSRPLHVDCSVEYELPSQVKPPPPTNGKIDPLLMIHPCYFRKIEAQRRSPFINNLPNRGNVSTSVSTNSTVVANTVSNNNRCTTNRIISGQNSTQPVVCHSRPIKTQQQQQPYPVAGTLPHYQQQQQQHQHGWPTESTAVGTVNKHNSNHPQQHQHHHQHHHHHHHQHHQLPSCAAGYNANTAVALEGGLWTNTNHSPLAAERFPEPQVTLHQIQPTITATTDNISNNNNAASSSSCSKNHILATGKYRQYLRTHRLHPYMSMATTAFPQFTQMQQISCYNV